MHKVGRNDPCPCGSGKKYKKCCEGSEKHKKFHAEVLTPSAQPGGASKVSSLFFKKTAPPEVPAEHPKNPDL